MSSLGIRHSAVAVTLGNSGRCQELLKNNLSTVTIFLPTPPERGPPQKFANVFVNSDICMLPCPQDKECGFCSFFLGGGDSVGNASWTTYFSGGPFPGAPFAHGETGDASQSIEVRLM